MNEEEFKAKLVEAATKMEKDGVKPEQIQSFIDGKKAEYVKKKEQSNQGSPSESFSEGSFTESTQENGGGQKQSPSSVLPNTGDNTDNQGQDKATIEYVPPLLRRQEDVPEGMSSKDYKVQQAKSKRDAEVENSIYNDEKFLEKRNTLEQDRQQALQAEPEKEAQINTYYDAQLKASPEYIKAYQSAAAKGDKALKEEYNAIYDEETGLDKVKSTQESIKLLDEGISKMEADNNIVTEFFDEDLQTARKTKSTLEKILQEQVSQYKQRDAELRGVTYKLDGEEISRSELEKWAKSPEGLERLAKSVKDAKFGSYKDYIQIEGDDSELEGLIAHNEEVGFIKEGQGVLGRGLMGAGATAVDLLGGIGNLSAQMLATPAGMQTEEMFLDRAKRIKAVSDDIRPEQTIGADALDKITGGDIGGGVSDLTEMSIESAPYMLAAYSPTALFGSMASSKYSELRNDGVDKDKAFVGALGSAAVNTADAMVTRGLAKNAANTMKVGLGKVMQEKGLAATKKEAAKAFRGAFLEEMPTEFAQGTSDAIIDDWARGKEIDFGNALHQGALEAMAASPTSTVISMPHAAQYVYATSQELGSQKQRAEAIEETAEAALTETDEVSADNKAKQFKILSEDYGSVVDESVEVSKAATKEESKQLSDISQKVFDLEKSLNDGGMSEATTETVSKEIEELNKEKDGIIDDIKKRQEDDKKDEERLSGEKQEGQKPKQKESDKITSKEKTETSGVLQEKGQVEKSQVFNESIDSIKEVKPPTKAELKLKEEKKKSKEKVKAVRDDFKDKFTEYADYKKKQTKEKVKAAKEKVVEKQKEKEQRAKKIEAERKEVADKKKSLKDIKKTLRKSTDALGRRMAKHMTAYEGVSSKIEQLATMNQTMAEKRLTEKVTDLDEAKYDKKVAKVQSDLDASKEKYAKLTASLEEKVNDEAATQKEIEDYHLLKGIEGLYESDAKNLEDTYRQLKEDAKVKAKERKEQLAKEKAETDAIIKDVEKATEKKKSWFGLRSRENKRKRPSEELGSEKAKRKKGTKDKDSATDKAIQWFGGFWNMQKLINDIDGSGTLERNVVDPFVKAVETYYQGLEDSMKALNKAVSKNHKDFETFAKAVNKLEPFKYTNKNGKEIYVSPSNLIRTYAWSLDAQLKAELEAEGITSKMLNKAIPSKIRSSVDSIVEFLSKDYYEGMNKVYKDKNGTDLTAIEYYFPVERQDVGGDSKTEAGEGGFIKPANPVNSSVKERSETKRKLAITSPNTDFFTALDKHITEGERYKAYTPIMKRINTIINSPRVKRIASSLGISKLLRDSVEAQVNPKPKEKTEQAMAKTTRFLYTMALSMKPIMAVKQASSAFLSPLTNKRGVRNWLTTMVKAWVKGDLALSKFKDISASVRARSKMSLAELESGQAGLGLKTKSIAEEVGGFPIKVGDMLGVSGHFVNYLSDIYAGVSEEDALAAFNKDYNSIQQAGTEYRMFKSGHQNSEKHLVAVAAMFLSSPSQYINNATIAAKNIAQGKDKRRNMKKFIANVIVSQAAFNLASSLQMVTSGYLTEDEDEMKEGMEDFWRSILLLKTIESIPVIGTPLNNLAVKPMIESAEALLNDIVGNKVFDEKYKTYNKKDVFTSSLRWIQPLFNTSEKIIDNKKLEDNELRDTIIRLLSVGSALKLNINPEHIIMGTADAYEKAGDKEAADAYIETFQILMGVPEIKRGEFDFDKKPTRAKKKTAKRAVRKSRTR